MSNQQFGEPDQQTSLTPAEDFTQQLLLRKVDRDIFTGLANGGGPIRTYGGQVAAQSLMAAGMTVDDLLLAPWSH